MSTSSPHLCLDIRSDRTVYAAVFNLKHTFGPVGRVSHSKEDVLGFLHAYADAALLHLDDWVNNTEWFTRDGNRCVDPRDLLASKDSEEVASAISQINELLLVQDLGCMKLAEFSDIYELLEHRRVWQRCSPSVKERAQELELAEERLVSELSEEWARIA